MKIELENILDDNVRRIIPYNISVIMELVTLYFHIRRYVNDDYGIRSLCDIIMRTINNGYCIAYYYALLTGVN